MGLKNEEVKEQQSTGDEEYHIDMSYILERSYDWIINDRVIGIFCLFIGQGKKVTEEMIELLHEAFDAGKISHHEFGQVLSVDLLWSGQLRTSGLNIVLTIEISCNAEAHDIELAVTCANILRRIGINALPVVASRLWDKDKPIMDLAIERGVVIIEGRQINEDTWDSALHYKQ